MKNDQRNDKKLSLLLSSFIWLGLGPLFFSNMLCCATDTDISALQTRSPGLSNSIQNHSKIISQISPRMIGSMNPINTNLSESLGKNLTESANGDDCSSVTAMCHIYIRRMVKFYEKIGGWVMLGVVIIGASCLVITYFLGKRKFKHGNKELVTIRRWDVRRSMRIRTSKQTWI